MGLKCIKRIRVVSEGIAILAILALALLVRLPQLNFPSIGYHNMKENEYISMAQHMLKTGELTGRHVYFTTPLMKTKNLTFIPRFRLSHIRSLLDINFSTLHCGFQG